MKHYLITTIGILAIALSSCHSDEEIDDYLDYPQPPSFGLLYDGGTISELNMYCTPKDELPDANDYLQRVKTIDSYSDLMLYIKIDDNKPRYECENTKDRQNISVMKMEYYREKTAFILKKFEEDLWEYLWKDVDFFTAYTRESVTISCDRVLFGEEPGTDLSKYFNIDAQAPIMAVGIENPKMLYAFGSDLPETMDQYFPNETWLQPRYEITLAKEPEEKYDSITFRFSMPITVEDVDAYMVDKYYGKDSGQKLEKVDLNAECLVKFDWKK